MHRSGLLAALAEYGVRHREETELVDRFTEFVRANPDCFRRELRIGHVTGSAWVVDPSGERILLTHHRKLDIWVQLGGHTDGDADVLASAVREAREESSLPDLVVLDVRIFDLDIHRIPARGRAGDLRFEPEHWHYDVRFALRTDQPTRVRATAESKELRWVDINALARVTEEPSMLRMARKWRAVRSV